jgi:hexokinase
MHHKRVLNALHDSLDMSTCKILQLSKQLQVSQDLSAAIQEDMLKQMKAGLAHAKEPSSLLMLPSCLSELPTGNETGDVIAIDMGGTSFRVMYAVLGAARGQVVRFCQFVALSALR